MEKNTIETLEKEVIDIRTSYKKSGGAEWLRLVVVLKVLIQKYTSQQKFEKAAKCKIEVEEILNNVQNRTVMPLQDCLCCETMNTYYKEISEWSAAVEKSKKELNEKGLITNYVNAVNTLCKYLCLARHYQVALLKYEEVLQILLSTPFSKDDDSDRLYITIVIFLSSAICAREIGKEDIARYYSVYPLLYLTKNMDKINPYTCWSYVAELCSKIINKQVD